MENFFFPSVEPILKPSLGLFSLGLFFLTNGFFYRVLLFPEGISLRDLTTCKCLSSISSVPLCVLTQRLMSLSCLKFKTLGLSVSRYYQENHRVLACSLVPDFMSFSFSALRILHINIELKCLCLCNNFRCFVVGDFLRHLIFATVIKRAGM